MSKAAAAAAAALGDAEELPEPSDATCSRKCGHFTDPASLAAFDVSPMCGHVVHATGGDESWAVNVCGAIKCASSPGFCAWEDLSVCGVDGESATAGMVLRTNYSEPCGAHYSCPRCLVAAAKETREAVWTWSLIDAKNPAQGVQAVLPIVPLTGAQLKQHDPNGFCTGGNGRVATLRFLCDCRAVEPRLDRVWTDADASCTMYFDIIGADSCYVGFCQGEMPPALNSAEGAEVSWFLWLFFFAGSLFILRQAWLKRGAAWMGTGERARGPRPDSSVYTETVSPSTSESAALL